MFVIPLLMQLRFCRFALLLFLVLSARTASAQLVADPDPVDFGDVILTEFKDMQMTLENPTATDIIVYNFYLFGGNARDNEYSVLAPATRTFLVPAGQKRNLQFRLAPDFEGIRSKQLIVETNVDTLTIQLTGTGLVTKPILTLSVTDINFGKVSVTGQKQFVVDITNIGDDDAKVSDVNVANFSGIEHFKVLPDDPLRPFPVILKTGESMRLRVIFDGAEPTGFKAGVLTLVGSVGGQTTINVTGEVVELDIIVSPDPIEFGDVPIGVAQTQKVTISVLGEEPMQIDFFNDLFAPFSFVNVPEVPLTIEPGKPYELEIQVIPQSVGSATSQLQMISEDFAGPNFRGIDIRVNGTGPLAIQASEDFTYYCASKKLQRRTATIRNRAMDPINVQSAIAPAGVQIVSGLPLSITGHGDAEIEYDFDPTIASGPQLLSFEYLDETGSTIYDTVLATPIPAVIVYPQANDAANNVVAVTSSIDFTDFESTTLSIELRVHHPDVVAITRDSITLDPTLLPNAAFDLRENGAGSYTLEITSPAPIEFDPTLPLTEQTLFTYRPKLFLADMPYTYVTVNATPDGSCNIYLTDSTMISREDFCGDQFVENVLRDRAISGISLYPNPVTSSELRIGFEAAIESNLAVEVVTLSGVLVANEMHEIRLGSNELTLDVSSLAEGTYFLRLRNGLRSQQLRFVIER